jgi:hypothetical protein
MGISAVGCSLLAVGLYGFGKAFLFTFLFWFNGIFSICIITAVTM